VKHFCKVLAQNLTRLRTEYKARPGKIGWRKLSLDDKLAAYVAGIPNGERITVRQLLGMTSGIYDFTRDEQFLKDFAANPLMPFGPQDVVAIVKRHQPEFAPSEKISYCDTSYTFLGMILEKVAGKPVAQVMRSKF